MCRSLDQCLRVALLILPVYSEDVEGVEMVVSDVRLVVQTSNEEGRARQKASDVIAGWARTSPGGSRGP